MSEAILVTGASGFIGSHLVSALRAAGHVVYGHSRPNGHIATCPLEFQGVRHVFHLAGKAYVPESWQAPHGFYEVNVLGTVNVLEFCRRHSASVTLISSYVYGKPLRLPIDEDHPVQPFNPYSHTKILAEEVGRYYATQFAVPVFIVRPFNVYGPGQDRRFLIPTLIAQALDPACEQITLADLRPRRDYIHVNDLVDLLVATMQGTAGTTYNAGSGRSVTIGELIATINAVLGQAKPVASKDEFRPNEVLDVVADISRARRELGWSPRISLADGLRETIASMRVEPAADLQTLPLS